MGSLGFMEYFFRYKRNTWKLIPENSIEGKTDFDEVGYGGPAPPDKEHTYIFKLYALNETLNLKKDSTKEEIEKSMKQYILDEVKLEGKFAP